MFQLECRSFVFPKSSQLYQGRTKASLHQQPSCREATVLTWAPPCCWHSTQIQNETCRSCMKCFSFNSKETVKSSSSKTPLLLTKLGFRVAQIRWSWWHGSCDSGPLYVPVFYHIQHREQLFTRHHVGILDQFYCVIIVVHFICSP